MAKNNKNKGKNKNNKTADKSNMEIGKEIKNKTDESTKNTTDCK